MINEVRIELINSAWIDTDNTVSGFLDVEVGTNFPLNFSVQDIRDISKKTGVFSKTLTLAGTKNNNMLLNNYFDLNIEAGSFNLNKKQEVIVYQNNIPILNNATIQLVSCNKIELNNNQEQKITYSIILKDSTSDLFSSISNSYLQDLDMTDMNHIFTADNVVASFDNTILDGYKYVLPNTGAVATSGLSFSLADFQPGIYAKKYMDKIFGKAGFSYTWSDLAASNVQFDKLIIPYNGDSQVGITASVYTEFYNNTLQTYQATMETNTESSVSMPNEISDTYNAYNTTTSKYTYPNVTAQTESVKFAYTVTYDLVIVNNSGVTAYVETVDPLATNKLGLFVRPLIGTYKNSSIEYFSVLLPTTNYLLANNTSISTGTTVLTTGTSITTHSDFYPVTGDVYEFRTTTPMYGKRTGGVGAQAYNFYKSADRSAGIADVKVYLKIKTIDIVTTIATNTSGYNGFVNMNALIPKQIKQSDFVKSIFTMYNLIAEVNPDNINNIILKHRDTYYDDGKVVNWDKKIMAEKEKTLNFLPELSNKKLLLSYKEDKDIANAGYKSNTGEIYGQLEYTFDNEYVKGTTKQEIIFSPTPVQNISNGAVVPIWTSPAPKTNIRILIDGGTYSCGSYIIENYPGSTKTVDYYPHISHFDKPVNPTLDINFGTCDYYFYTDSMGSLTNNNLFNLYWRRTLNQINTGKMYIAYFDLTEWDISNMRLSDKIEVDNSWWNINKIIDYNPNINGPTKVELISIDSDTRLIPYRVKPFVDIKLNPKDPRFKPVRDIWIKDRPIETKNTVLTKVPVSILGRSNTIGEQVLRSSILGDSNTIYSSIDVIGSNNIVLDNVTKSSIMGDSNTFGGDNSNILVNGNNNYIAPGVSGVTVLGDNATVTESNSIVITGNLIITCNYVGAGRNEVLNMFPSNKIINYVSGSRNCVRQFGTQDVVSLVSGGRYYNG